MIQLGLLAGVSQADAAIQKKLYGSESTALIISIEQIEDIMKIVKLLESGLLIKRISETIKQRRKGTKRQISPGIIRDISS